MKAPKRSHRKGSRSEVVLPAFCLAKRLSVSNNSTKPNPMLHTPHPRIVNIRGIKDDERARAQDFLQGAVYCWCKNRPAEWFSLRDLMGGANNDCWAGTPLIPFYNKHAAAADAVKRAGQDCGRLLLAVINADFREFKTRLAERNRQYCWIQSPTA